MQALENELKGLIVEALMLDDINPASIDSDAPLFRVGLGLDSIDALELAIAIERRFGVKIAADDESNKATFSCVASLARFIADARAVPEESR